MTAISKSWVTIADAAVDPDSPLDTTLMTGLRDDVVHLREWLGASYYAGAEQDHNHDGVNSKLVAGAMVKLASQTGSGASYLTFSGNFSSTYKDYFFRFKNLVPGNAARVLVAEVSISGSWQTTAGYYEYASRGLDSAGTSLDFAGTDPFARFVEGSNGVDNNANIPGLGGDLVLCDPLDATHYKTMGFRVWYRRSTSNKYAESHGMNTFIGSTSALDGIRFSYQLGGVNTITGTIDMFGLAN